MALDVPGVTPVVLVRGDDQWEFCSEECKELFLEDPARYEAPSTEEEE